MNDCFWNWIDKCEAKECRCSKYLSVNSEEGDNLLGKYHNKVKVLDDEDVEISRDLRIEVNKAFDDLDIEKGYRGGYLVDLVTFEE